MNDSPRILAFFSYKGGVGRSMAVINTAYVLAAAGRRVLVVDMDLEAPGISGFFRRSEAAEAGASGDVLSLLSWAVDLARAHREAAPSAEELHAQAPPIESVAVGVEQEKLRLGRPAPPEARLDVIAAREDGEYFGRLQDLGLAGLERGELLATGGVLRLYFQALRVAVPPIEGSAEEVPGESLPYDYVLLDSRTGVSESGGLCIGPLSDLLVVLTSLNEQNVQGTRRFLAEVGLQLSPGRSGEGTPAEGAVLGPKPTIVVASPVPGGEIDFKRQRIADLEKWLGRVSVQLPYHPQVALMESAFVRDYPDEYLAQEYRRLAMILRQAGRDDPDSIMNHAQAAWVTGQHAEAIRRALRASGDPEARAALALFQRLFKPSSDPDFVLANRLASVFSRGGAGTAAQDAFYDWGTLLSAWAETKGGEEAKRLWRLAQEKYEAAARVGGVPRAVER